MFQIWWSYYMKGLTFYICFGKWKGVTGAGKAFAFTKGKPISPETFQSYIKITGAYELKK